MVDLQAGHQKKEKKKKKALEREKEREGLVEMWRLDTLLMKVSSVGVSRKAVLAKSL